MAGVVDDWPQNLLFNPLGLPISPTPQFIAVCPICLRTSNSSCYHSSAETAAKLRAIYEAMLDAWLGPKEGD